MHQEMKEEAAYLCEWCRTGIPCGKIIAGTKINGFYAHRIDNKNVVCAADHIWQADELTPELEK